MRPKCSVRALIRDVKMATWTSGEPVSCVSRRYAPNQFLLSLFGNGHLLPQSFCFNLSGHIALSHFPPPRSLKLLVSTNAETVSVPTAHAFATGVPRKYHLAAEKARCSKIIGGHRLAVQTLSLGGINPTGNKNPLTAGRNEVPGAESPATSYTIRFPVAVWPRYVIITCWSSDN